MYTDKDSNLISEQQEAFDEINRQLQKPPVLYIPDNRGRFHIYSDTSKFTTGSALYQILNGQTRLTAYASKRMATATQNYSITYYRFVWISS